MNFIISIFENLEDKLKLLSLYVRANIMQIRQAIQDLSLK